MDSGSALKTNARHRERVAHGGLSTNHLQWFDFAFIPKSLEWLDVHNNRIGDKIGNYYSLSTGFNLQTFDASFNKIKELRADTLLSGLKNIYLNNNKIGTISAGAFKGLSNLTRVELQGNELRNIDIEALATSQTGRLDIYVSHSSKECLEKL